MSASEFLDQKLGQVLSGDPSFLKSSGINSKTVLLDLEGPTGGKFFLEFDQECFAKFELKNQTPSADCVITMKDKVFLDLVKGKVNIPMALVTRKIKVKGDMNLAGKVALMLKDKLL